VQKINTVGLPKNFLVKFHRESIPHSEKNPYKGTVRLERCEFFPKLAKTVPYGLKWRGKIEKSAIEASPKI
jgi:hypothetical protein